MRSKAALLLILLAALARAVTLPGATNIAAVYQNGQTFITWTDAASSSTEQAWSYQVYRSTSGAITSGNLGSATLIETVYPNSVVLPGALAYTRANRMSSTLPTAIINNSFPCVANGACGTPLAAYTGVAAYTAVGTASAWYAVITVDFTGDTASTITAGQNATASSVSESVAAQKPIKIYDSNSNRTVAPNATTGSATAPTASLTSTANLPLVLLLHASTPSGIIWNAVNIGNLNYGDFYLRYGDTTMGWEDGLPYIFSLWERRAAFGLEYAGPGHYVNLTPQDGFWAPAENANCPPSGNAYCYAQSSWFGQYATLGSPLDNTSARKAQPYTETRLLSMIQFALATYNSSNSFNVSGTTSKFDPNRISISGISMGSWGTIFFGLRHPEIFAAAFAYRSHVVENNIQTPIPVGSVYETAATSGITMPDGTTVYGSSTFDSNASVRMNMVKYANTGNPSLPFLGWTVGRTDPFGPWAQHVCMVQVMEHNHYGFAFGYYNGGHVAAPAENAVANQYQTGIFALNVSYPAFSNSSIDDPISSGAGNVYGTPNTLTGGAMNIDNCKTTVNGAGGACDGTSVNNVCGVNLGFAWNSGQNSTTAPTDTSTQWSVAVSNSRMTQTTYGSSPCPCSVMHADITPRNTQTFRPTAGSSVNWTATIAGAIVQTGTATVDAAGLVTAPQVQINTGASTTISFQLPQNPRVAVNGRVGGAVTTQ